MVFQKVYEQILLLRENGYALTLSQILNMLDTAAEEYLKFAAVKISEIEAKVKQVEALLKELV